MKMKTTILIIGILLIAAAVAVLQHPAFGRRPSKERKARIEASPNFRDGMFQNQLPTPQFTGNKTSFKAMWTMLTERDNNRVPKQAVPAVKTVLKSLPTDKDWFVWFGHSSYLFQLNGKRFLVDPVLKLEFPSSLMLKPFQGTDIYSTDDLPEIDFLIITHEHWDHLDYPTLRDIRHKVKHTICPLGVAEYLDYWKYPPTTTTELDWYDTFTFRHDNESQIANCPTGNYQLTCLPSRHFSNRFLGGRNQTLWASFLVESDGRKVYIGGDGGYDDRFRQIREQYGTIDLAVLENGQYNANWAFIHTTPEDLPKAINDLQPANVFTVHHDKFALSTHAWNEPDSVAHTITLPESTRLLDQPIGTVVYF